MAMQQTQQDIIREFKGCNDWMDKYGRLIKLGKTLPPVKSEFKTEDTLIKGCQVRTWFHSSIRDGKVFFEVDSMSLIIKGIIVLLLRVLDGQQPKDIKDADLYFIDKTGLRENFSPIKANSLWKLVNQMKTDATTYEAQINK